MSMKEWIAIDIDNLEMLDVSDVEKKRVKSFVFRKRRRMSIFKNIAIIATLIFGMTTATSLAFPAFAAQIPFMKNVIHYFVDDSNRYKNFEVYSSHIGLVQSSNGITVMIDRAVYDGTNITVSYAIETYEDLGADVKAKESMIDVAGAIGGSGGFKLTKISETRYVGLSTLTPHFYKKQNPETVKVSWEPHSFYSMTNNIEIKGDWSFNFTLSRLDSDVVLLNKTVQESDITFTLQSVEYTDLSTIINYEQHVSKLLLKEWKSITPLFEITDNLGRVYLYGTGGGGVSTKNGQYFEGSTTFGTIEADVQQLIVKPIVLASLQNGEGLMEIELESIIIDIQK